MIYATTIAEKKKIVVERNIKIKPEDIVNNFQYLIIKQHCTNQ